MISQYIELLQTPNLGTPLKLAKIKGKQYLSNTHNNLFPIVNGIPHFVDPESLTELNKKNYKFYNKLSRFAHILDLICALFIDYNKVLRSRIEGMNIRPDDKVLDIATGTGWNFKLLPKSANYFGIDISPGMLKQCQNNLKRWKRRVNLFQGIAEALPFKSNSFDLVYYIGGIGFISNTKLAIHEMIRVAKPGKRIFILDDTENHIKTVHQKIFFTRNYFKDLNVTERTTPPIKLLPNNVKDIQLKYIDKEKTMYQLSFIKTDKI